MAAQRLLWLGGVMGCSFCNPGAGWWGNPSAPSAVFSLLYCLCSASATWVPCEPHCARALAIWASPHPLAQLSTCTSAFSMHQLRGTSASLGILLCTALGTGEPARLLPPSPRSKRGCSMLSLPSACTSGREAHTPW